MDVFKRIVLLCLLTVIWPVHAITVLADAQISLAAPTYLAIIQLNENEGLIEKRLANLAYKRELIIRQLQAQGVDKAVLDVQPVAINPAPTPSILLNNIAVTSDKSTKQPAPVLWINANSLAVNDQQQFNLSQQIRLALTSLTQLEAIKPVASKLAAQVLLQSAYADTQWQQHLQQALKQASQTALARAQVLAKAQSVELGELLSVETLAPTPTQSTLATITVNDVAYKLSAENAIDVKIRVKYAIRR